jgi:hypothetical protein
VSLQQQGINPKQENTIEIFDSQCIAFAEGVGSVESLHVALNLPVIPLSGVINMYASVSLIRSIIFRIFGQQISPGKKERKKTTLMGWHRLFALQFSVP